MPRTGRALSAVAELIVHIYGEFHLTAHLYPLNVTELYFPLEKYFNCIILTTQNHTLHYATITVNIHTTGNDELARDHR